LYKIYDDWLDMSIADYIEETLLSVDFPWHYARGTTFGQDAATDGDSRFEEFGFFSHFFHNGLAKESCTDPNCRSCKEASSQFYSLAKDVFDIFMSKHDIEIEEIFRMRANFSTRSLVKKISPPHIDYPFDHKVFLYYVNDSDGDTVFFEYQADKDMSQPHIETSRVSPKKGRAIVFDGNLLHGLERPMNHEYRLVLNNSFKTSLQKSLT
jgi:hypothetical protein